MCSCRLGHGQEAARLPNASRPSIIGMDGHRLSASSSGRRLSAALNATSKRNVNRRTTERTFRLSEARESAGAFVPGRESAGTYKRLTRQRCRSAGLMDVPGTPPSTRRRWLRTNRDADSGKNGIVVEIRAVHRRVIPYSKAIAERLAKLDELASQSLTSSVQTGDTHGLGEEEWDELQDEWNAAAASCGGYAGVASNCKLVLGQTEVNCDMGVPLPLLCEPRPGRGSGTLRPLVCSPAPHLPPDPLQGRWYTPRRRSCVGRRASGRPPPPQSLTRPPDSMNGLSSPSM